MDIASFLGLILGAAFLAFAVGGAKGASWTAFFDLPSLLLVGGGTLACVLIALPFGTVLNSLRVCTRVFFNRQQDIAALIDHIVSLAEIARRDGLLALEERLPGISDPFLALGAQMAVDGNRPDVIEEALRTEIDAVAERHRNGRLVPEQMGRFAPAFGMIGTLMGLILMLGNMSHPEAIGPGMAVAMVTALYGVLMANLLFLPFAEKLGYISRHELLAMEVVVRGILAIQAGENPRVIQQKLDTFLPLRRSSSAPQRPKTPTVTAQGLDLAGTQLTNLRRQKAA